MSTRVSVGLDNHQDGYQCGREAARAALDGINDDTVSLALLFTSHPDPARVLKGVNDMIGNVTLVGATAVGVYTHESYVEQGTGVMLIGSDNIQFYPLTQQRRWFGRGSLLGKLHGISEEGLGSPFNNRALMLFPDDQSMNLDGVVERAMTETAMMYDILGGPGPTIRAQPPRLPAVFYNRRMLKAGLTGTEILSKKPLGFSLANGWTPLAGPYRVTQVKKRKLVKIDGRPAREVYEDFMSDHDILPPSNIEQRHLLQHPIGICKDGNCKVSVPLGFDRNGAMLITSPPSAGSLIYILHTAPDAMVTAAQRAVQQALDNLDRRSTRSAGALFIDCMSAGMVLGEAYPRQQAAVRECLGDIPFLGYRSHGVLARLQGQIAGHYECSVVTCILPAWV